MIGLIDEQEHENLFIQEQYAKSLILATKYNETIAYLKQNVYNKIEKAGYQRLYDLRYEKPMHGHYTFERYMQKVVKYEPFVSSIHAEGLQFRTQSELLIEEIMKPVDNILTTILQHYKVITDSALRVESSRLQASVKFVAQGPKEELLSLEFCLLFFATHDPKILLI